MVCECHLELVEETLLLRYLLSLVTQDFALAFDLRSQSGDVLLLVDTARACAIVRARAWYVGRERKCAVAVNRFRSFQIVPPVASTPLRATEGRRVVCSQSYCVLGRRKVTLFALPTPSRYGFGQPMSQHDRLLSQNGLVGLVTCGGMGQERSLRGAEDDGRVQGMATNRRRCPGFFLSQGRYLEDVLRGSSSKGFSLRMTMAEG